MGEVRPLRRNRDFVLLWVSQVVSETGSQATLLAYPLLVLAISGSAVSAGLVGGVAALVRLVLRLPAGVVVDRVDRRRLMLACESARVCALGALGVAVLTGRATVVVVAIAAAVDAAGYVLFGAAERAGLRHLVPAPQLAAAAAGNEMRIHTANLIGPSLGGVLFGAGRAIPFLADALSYIVSLGAVALIRQPLQAPRLPNVPPTGWTRSLLDGWRFVVTQPFLRAMALVSALLNMAFTGAMFVVVVILQRAGMPPAGIGLAFAGIAAAGILGAALAPRLIHRIPARRLTLGLFWLMTATITVCALLPAGPWRTAPLPALVLLAPAVNATLFAYQTAVTPDHLHGRVISVLIFVATLANPIAPVLAGVLLEQTTPGLTFAIFAGFLATAALVASTSTGMRHIRLGPADES